ncbi:MAG: cupin domain-containing protein [Desulfatibacillaceae bacterium]
MFTKASDEGFSNPLPGIRLKPLAWGDSTMICEFRLEGGHTLPSHAHPHEQSGMLVSGRIRLTVGDEEFEAGPGDSWSIPGGVEHGAEVLEDSVAVEVFSPVREDYLP